MGNKPLGVLSAEQVRQFAAGPFRLAELRPGDGVETGIPQPLERIHRRIRNGVSLGAPIGLEDRASRSPNLIGIGR